jgi:hypothetical protein
VCVCTEYTDNYTGLNGLGSIPGKVNHGVQTRSAVRPASFLYSEGGYRSLRLGLKRPGREDYHSPPSPTVSYECMELYIHFAKRLHEVVLNQVQGQLSVF